MASPLTAPAAAGAAAARQVPSRPGGRRPELDVMRALVVAGLVVFGPDASTGGWERLAYVFPFAYGFLIASDARFESALSRARWPAVAVAAAATAGLLGWAAAAGPGVVSGAEPGWSALQGLAGWAWLAAIAGFAAALTARRRSVGSGEPRPAPAREPAWQRAARYANQAVLPFYLLHEPVIVAFAWIIVRWHAPILVEYPVLVAASFTATLVIYELAVRRYRPTRFLFGMNPPAPKERATVPAGCVGRVMPNLPGESQDRSDAASQGSQNVADMCSRLISAHSTVSRAESAIRSLFAAQRFILSHRDGDIT